MKKFGLLAIALVVSFLVLAAGLGAWEWALRRSRAKIPTQPDPARLVPDAEMGWTSDPLIKALDNTGLKRKIYFLGDSFTHGTQWTAIAQRAARARGVRFDGFNLGVSGYGTAQEFLHLRRNFDQHDPEMIVLLFFAWNDMRDNFWQPAIYYNAQTRHRPYLEPGHEVKVRKPTRPCWIERLHIYPMTVLRAEYHEARILTRLFGIDTLTRHKCPSHVSYTFADSWKVFYRPDEPRVEYREKAWEATETAFAHFVDYLGPRHAKLIVLALDNPFTVDQDVFDAYLANEPGVDVNRPLDRLGEILARQGIRYVNCAPELRQLSKKLGRRVYLGGLSGHLTPEAEDVIGQIAAREIAAVPPRDR